MTDYDFDVVVVGSGAAGLSAALAATQDGAAVLVAEGEGIVGGSSRLSGGLMMGADTRYQRALGIEQVQHVRQLARSFARPPSASRPCPRPAACQW